MGKKVTLPGKKNYGKGTAWMRKTQVYTKAQLVQYLEGECGCSPSAALATAVVLLSPRLTSKRGDPRGHVCNPWGHLAYNEKLPRKTLPTGKNEAQRFRFRLRKNALEPRKRGEVNSVAAKKTKTETKVTAKSKTKVKA